MPGPTIDKSMPNRPEEVPAFPPKETLNTEVETAARKIVVVRTEPKTVSSADHSQALARLQSHGGPGRDCYK